MPFALSRSFRLFSQADDGAAPGGPSAGVTDPDPKEKELEPAAKATKTKEKTETPPAIDKTQAKLDALSEELKAHKSLLEKYKAKEQEELDKQKTAEQKLAEREAEIAKLNQANLVERVRREGGFTEKAFDLVNAKGSTFEEIKAEFDSYKSALDEYVASTGRKPAQGDPADSGKPSPKASNAEAKTYLHRIGLIKEKAAV